jgi:hypothetical protein
MPTKVQSPVSRPGSRVGSGQPFSPGAFSNPSRGDRGRRDTGNNAPEPSYEPAGQRARDRRDEEQQEQQRRDRQRDAEEQQNEERWQQAHAVASANSEPEMPERQERERADSLASNVFGLIKRMYRRSRSHTSSKLSPRAATGDPCRRQSQLQQPTAAAR